eukprot:TRINITY_DN12191_c0_g1_i1.p1 TRINITY_DN12191_c0_g1~~TRINITY_DN12191_c0_g1_i1.p1  ORF type:complete len:103 (-),score=18.06 TRINITY_DN12191_c0_g1_i1:93-401(-)
MEETQERPSILEKECQPDKISNKREETRQRNLGLIKKKIDQITKLEQELLVKKQEAQDLEKEDPSLAEDLNELIITEEKNLKKQKNRLNWFLHFTTLDLNDQ